MIDRRLRHALCTFVLAAAVMPASAFSHDQADKPKPRGSEVDAKLYQKTVDRGIQYLVDTAQNSDGSYSKEAGTGVTALAATALLRHGRSPDDPAVAKSLKILADSLRPDGALAPDKSRIPNYETCLTLSALALANKDGRYDDILKQGEKYVRGVQIDEGEGKQKSDFTYGGSGYGADSRPDLSNTAFLMDTLHDLGAGPDDEAIQKALVFVSRCQNLESAHNTTRIAAANQDGGFIYTISEGSGGSPAGATDNAGLRSYGTMTYAGLKSMIYAGVSEDDPRVKAALGWLRKHYNLKENPPMGDAGLFYYYHTLAKCLDSMGDTYFEDEGGVKHDWRKEIVEELASRQKENGSWINQNRRWMESDPNLVTAYSLIVLSYCKPQLPSAAGR